MKSSHNPVVSLDCVGVFWDLQNVPCKTQQQLTCLMMFDRSYGVIRHRYAYTDWSADRKAQGLQPVFDQEDFECISVSTTYKNQADRKLKKHWRHHLQQDHLLKTLILLSCDGGYKDIVQEAKDQGKQVIVVASSRKQPVSEELISLADRIVYLDQIEKAFSLLIAA